jgi:hypothetical protein
VIASYRGGVGPRLAPGAREQGRADVRQALKTAAPYYDSPAVTVRTHNDSEARTPRRRLKAKVTAAVSEGKTPHISEVTECRETP